MTCWTCRVPGCDGRCTYRDEGMVARLAGDAILDNPYLTDPYPSCRDAWNQGWLRADLDLRTGGEIPYGRTEN